MENIKIVSLENLIKSLQEQLKKGIEYIEIKGTLYSSQDGNTILCTSEKQW